MEKWDLGVENVAANTSHGSGMDVDLPEHGAEKEEEEKEEEEEEEEEDSSDTTMIPMADMLNARYESENVCAILSLRKYYPCADPTAF